MSTWWTPAQRADLGLRPAWLETLVAVHPRHVLAWDEPLPAGAPLTVPPGLEMRSTDAEARDEMRAFPGRWALVLVGTPRRRTDVG